MLHRAFDRGLVSVDIEYKIIMSNCFTEALTNSIKDYSGKAIILPDQLNYIPSQENLKWHRENIFKG